MITTVGLNLLRDALHGDVTDAQIKYVAWGSGTTAPALTDTKLVTEIARHAVTTRTKGTTGILDTIAYMAPGDVNSAIKEIGFFAGATAGAGADTGVLVCRVLYNDTIAATQSLNIDLKDTLAEV